MSPEEEVNEWETATNKEKSTRLAYKSRKALLAPRARQPRRGFVRSKHHIVDSMGYQAN